MIVNEGSSFSLNCKPYDDGESVTPGTARYKIECLTNGRTVHNWATLTASASMDIPVIPDDNVILSEQNRVERRQMQVQTDFDTDDQGVFYYEWDVKNLQG